MKETIEKMKEIEYTIPSTGKEIGKTIDELGISPTPWFANNVGNVRDNIADTVAKMVNVYKDETTVKANARLIAAAPDMYVALNKMLSVWSAIREKSEYNGGLLKDIPMFADASLSAFDALEKAGGWKVKTMQVEVAK